MKKKTLRLMNGIAQMIENSNPYLNKKGKKLIFENFMYNSMLNELSRLAEDQISSDDDLDSLPFSTRAKVAANNAFTGAKLGAKNTIRKGKSAFNTGKNKITNYFSDKTAPNDLDFDGFDSRSDFKKDLSKLKHFGKKSLTDLGNSASDMLEKGKYYGNVGMDAVMDNPGMAASIAAAIAITGWGAKKAYDFVKKNGPEGVEALKSKIKPSMMGKVKSKFKTLMAKMAFAESVGVNPLLALKKKI